VPALVKADQLRPAIPAAYRSPEASAAIILFPPSHQRRHFDAPQPLVQPLRSSAGFPECFAPLAIVHRQLSVKIFRNASSLSQLFIENRFSFRASPPANSDSNPDRLVLLQPRRIYKHRFSLYQVAPPPISAT